MMTYLTVRKNPRTKLLSVFLALTMFFTLGFPARLSSAATIAPGSVTLEGYNVAEVKVGGVKQWVGSYVTGNLGKTYSEGEWYPGRMRIYGIQTLYPDFAGFPEELHVSYDAYVNTSAGSGMFVDLVKGIQLGTTPLTSEQGWPKADGSSYPVASDEQLNEAQNHPGVNQWPNYQLLNLPANQMNRSAVTATFGQIGSITDQRRMFTVTKQDVLNALAALGKDYKDVDSFDIYFEMHLARTSIWAGDYQDVYADPAKPAYNWGGYLYGVLNFDPVQYGSGPISGSSGHFDLVEASKTVPLPQVPEIFRTVTGKKFYDLNNNGAFDAGEPPLSGWVINLTGQLEDMDVTLTDTTDANGIYEFGSLSFSTELRVHEALQTGWIETYPYMSLPALANGATPMAFTDPGQGPVGWFIAKMIPTASLTLSGVDFGNFQPLPSFTIEKTGDELSKIGDPITFTVTVVNTGNVDLKLVSMTDDRFGALEGFSAVLAKGATESHSYTKTVPEGASDPFVNTVTASYQFMTMPAVTHSDDHSTNLFQPSSAISKQVDKATAIPGETVHYTITVSNTSSEDTPVLHYTLTDELLGWTGVNSKLFDLLSGESKILEADYTIPESAVKGSVIKNTAVFNTTFTDYTNVLTGSASVNTTVQVPSILVTKTGDPLSKRGDMTSFTFTVKNTGDTPLTLVEIKDTTFNVDLASHFSETLAAGAEESWTGEFEIPLDAVNPFVNEMTAVYKYAVGAFEKQVSSSDTHSVNLFVPSSAITKTVDKAFAIPGETVHYIIQVTNTSSLDTPLMHYVLTDELLGWTGANAKTFDLGSTESKTLEADYVIPETAKSGDIVTNLAMIDTSFDKFPNKYHYEASVNTLIQVPGLLITKTGDTLSKLGDLTSFTFTVKNTGDTPLTLVEIKDATLNANLASHFSKTLAAGAEESWTGEFRIPMDAADPFENKMSAIYEYAQGSFVKQISAEATHSVNLFQPSSSIVKSVDKATAIPGETVQYTIIVNNENSEDAPPQNYVLTDELLGWTGANAKSFTLPSKTSTLFIADYVIPETAKSGDVITNTAVIDTSFDRFPNVSHHEAMVTTLVQEPGIMITKTGDMLSKLGDPTSFTFTVKNTGDTPLTLVEVRDATFNVNLSGHFSETLAPGAEESWTESFAIPANAPDPFVNKMTAAYKYVAGAFEKQVLAEATHSVDLFQPLSSIIKSVDKVTAVPGETVHYTIMVSNDSSPDSPIQNYVLTDALLGWIGDTAPIFSLAPEMSAVFEADFVIPGDVQNGVIFTNVAVIDTSFDNFPNKYTYYAAVDTTVQVPAIMITKTGDELSKLGDPTSFTFTVSNIGATPLNLVEVRDETFNVDLSEHFSSTLAVGAEESWTGTFDIPSNAPDPFVNKMTAIYKYVQGSFEKSVSAEAAYSVNLFQPLSSITKTVDKATAIPGETIHYTITVTNLSSLDTPLQKYVLSDTLLGWTDLAVKSFTLESQESAKFEADYIIPMTAKKGDIITNTAVIDTSFDKFPNTFNYFASVITTVQEPSILVTKTGDPLSKRGDMTSFTFTVKNTGDTPLTLVEIKDTTFNVDLSEHFSSTLAAGAEESWTSEFEIPVDAVNPFVNEMTAVYKYAVGAFEKQVSSSDTHSVNLFVPSSAITKTVDKAFAIPGETVHYIIQVTNTSSLDTPLMHYVLTDELLGWTGANAKTFDLESTESKTLEADYVIPETAKSGDIITNTAVIDTFFDKFPNKYNYSASVITTVQEPSILVTKTGDTLSKRGDLTSFTFTVKNTGDTPLTLVEVRDETFNVDLSEHFSSILAVDAEESWTGEFRIPMDATDPFENKMTAIYEYAQGSFVKQISAEAAYSVPLFLPLSSITKTVDKAAAIPGETVHYTITVHNESSSITPLTHYVLTDELLGWTGANVKIFNLLPTEFKTLEADYLIPATAKSGDIITNTAVIDTSFDKFPNKYNYSASVITTVQEPSILVTKTGDTLSKRGDLTSFTFTVKNTGDTPLTLVEVRDVTFNADLSSHFSETLAAGAEESWTGDFTIPMDASDPFVNSAKATYQYVSGTFVKEVTSSDTHSVNLFQPSSAIAKIVDKAIAAPGETIHYTITVTNTSSSDTPDLHYTLTDELLGWTGANAKTFILQPTAIQTFEADYIIPTTAADGSVITNTAVFNTTFTDFPNKLTGSASAETTVKVPLAAVTAWAYGQGYAIPIDKLVPSANWGWTNGPLPEGDYSWPIYVGAAQNEITKGTIVGTLTIGFHSKTMTVTYTLDPGYTFSQIHLWVGNTKLPMTKGKNPTFSASPGQFKYTPSVEGLNEWSVTIRNLSGDVYVAAHSVVWIPQ